ncbi:MAG: helix-turn-helix transcriptional regulator, partial [Clostridiales bacterium]|nr:helix-turn-helix transcriptional regulator [Clostridiales bacterium]
ASAAHEVNVTNVYLSRLFKQELGIGFNEYLMQVRIKRAQLLLQQGKLSLRQIAECCGFQDYTYFLKVFKKQSGVTPKEYQRSCLCNSPQ